MDIFSRHGAWRGRTAANEGDGDVNELDYQEEDTRPGFDAGVAYDWIVDRMRQMSPDRFVVEEKDSMLLMKFSYVDAYLESNKDNTGLGFQMCSSNSQDKPVFFVMGFLIKGYKVGGGRDYNTGVRSLRCGSATVRISGDFATDAKVELAHSALTDLKGTPMNGHLGVFNWIVPSSGGFYSKESIASEITKKLVKYMTSKKEAWVSAIENKFKETYYQWRTK